METTEPTEMGNTPSAPEKTSPAPENTSAASESASPAPEGESASAEDESTPPENDPTSAESESTTPESKFTAAEGESTTAEDESTAPESESADPDDESAGLYDESSEAEDASGNGADGQPRKKRKRSSRKPSSRASSSNFFARMMEASDEPQPQFGVGENAGHYMRENYPAVWLGIKLAPFLIILGVCAIIFRIPFIEYLRKSRADRLTEEGKKLLATGNLPDATEAASRLEAADLLYPGDLDLDRLRLIIQAHITARTYKEAIPAAIRLASSARATMADRLLQVDLLRREKAWNQALAVLDKFIATPAGVDPDPAASEMLVRILTEGASNQGAEQAVLFDNLTLENDNAANAAQALLNADPANRQAEYVVASRLAGSYDIFKESEGTKRLLALAEGTDATALLALQRLTNIPFLSRDHLLRVADLLEKHPLAQISHRFLALRCRLRANPADRENILAQARVLGVPFRPDPATTPLTALDPKASPKDLPPETLAYTQFLLAVGLPQEAFALLPGAKSETSASAFRSLVDALIATNRGAEAADLIARRPAMLPPFMAAALRAVALYPTSHVQASQAWALALKLAATTTVKGSGFPLAEIAALATKHELPDAEYAFPAYAADELGCISMKPDSPQADSYLRWLYETGKTPALSRFASEMALRYPGNPYFRNNAIYLDLLLGRNLNNALAAAEQIVKENPLINEFRTTLALAYLRNKRPKDAAGILDAFPPEYWAKKAAPAALALRSAVAEALDPALAQQLPPLPKGKLLPEEFALAATK